MPADRSTDRPQDHAPVLDHSPPAPDIAPDIAPDVDADILRARAYLSRIAEPPAPHLGRLIADLGPVAAARRVAAGDVSAELATELRPHPPAAGDALAHGQAELDAAAATDTRLLVPEHPHWPSAALHALTCCPFTATIAAQTRPLALWVRGTAELSRLCERAVTVTGARAATGYGHHLAGEYAAEIARRGVTVVAGGALGIDAAAHRGALTAATLIGATLTGTGGLTVAVLACGVDVTFPAANGNLFEHILAAHGLLVSEYPPRCVPTRRRHLARQRLLAAFATRGLIVVEAGLRSAALTLAATARAYRRPVLAVPGPLTSTVSAGCHELIRHDTARLAAPPSGITLDLDLDRPVRLSEGG